MATAGDRYESLSGNIWSYAHRGDITGIKAALVRGVDVNIVNTAGWTACHAAAAGGQSKAIRVLVAAGANLSLIDRGGNLPVHQAAKNGHLRALEVLRDLGADLSRVRLSQTKGRAVREFILTQERAKGKIAGDENDILEAAVGYARKQSRSNAFWGPRKTPISGKIKKKILKHKRRLRIEQTDHANDDDLGVSNELVKDRVGLDEGDGTLERLDNQHNNDGEEVNLTYKETIQQVKRNRCARRRGRQRRQLKNVPTSNKRCQLDEKSQDKLKAKISTIAVEYVSEEDTDKDIQVIGSRFALLGSFDEN